MPPPVHSKRRKKFQGKKKQKYKINTIKFNSQLIPKIGSVASKTHTYRFSSENGVEWVQKVLSDSGNARSLIGKDLLDSKNIKFYPAEAGDNLYAANDSTIRVCGSVILTATFKNKTIFIDCLVTKDLSRDIIISGHEAELIGAITISPDSHPAKLKQLPSICSTKTHRTLSEKEISDKIAYFQKKYTVFRDTLPSDPCIKDVEMRIHLKDNLPKNIPKHTTAPKTPVAYEKHAKKLFEELIAAGQLERVPINQNTIFCSRGFVLPKKNSMEKYGPRLVVDYSHINPYIQRPPHPFEGGSEILKKINPKAKYFATFDSLHSYFTVKLHPDSRHITTFISSFGAFQFKCTPMGMVCSPDMYNQITDDIILPSSDCVHKLVDDILVWSETPEQLYEEIEKVLQACQKHNITLKKSKFTIGESVTFSGFKISQNGIEPTQERIECIKNFPQPKDRTSLKSFLGLGRTLAHMTPDLAYAEQGMRLLDRNKVSYVWTGVQEESFKLVKDILSGPLIVKNFDSSRKTRLDTDASRTGLGFALMQEEPETGNWVMIHCGSRALTPAEANYSVCNLELLAVVYALSKCRHWLLGFDNFTVVTDHMSLIGLFQKDLSEMPTPRLRRLREKCVEFSFHVDYRKGADHQIADALSRAPLWPCDFDLSDPSEEHICNLIKNDISDPLLQPLIKAANSCENYQKLITAIKSFKKFEDIPKDHCAREYSKVWRNLSIHSNGLVVLDLHRIVVPKDYRDHVLEILHTAHCGETKTKMFAKQKFYWPQINNSIEQITHECPECRRLLPSQQKEPVKGDFSAQFPMSDVSSDLFSIGQNFYLVLVDRYSGYPFCAKLKNITAASVIKQLYIWFTDFGWPVTMKSDQGTQYTSQDMEQFCQKYNIKQEFSSPHYAQSNGLSESAVKQMKFLMLKCNEDQDKFQLALQHWRNTTSHTGYSPSQLYFCRSQRTLLPALSETMEIDPECAILGSFARKEHHKQLCAQKSGKALKPLQPGQRVHVQDLRGLSKKPRWENVGTVVKVNDSGSSYLVHLDTGEKFSRNRVFLRPVRQYVGEAPENPADDSPVQDEPVTPRRSARLQGRDPEI